MQTQINGLDPGSRLSGRLYIIVESAQWGGMSKERAEAIYEDIRTHWLRMDDEFAGVLLGHIQDFLGGTLEQRNL